MFEPVVQGVTALYNFNLYIPFKNDILLYNKYTLQMLKTIQLLGKQVIKMLFQMQGNI